MEHLPKSFHDLYGTLTEEFLDLYGTLTCTEEFLELYGTLTEEFPDSQSNGTNTDIKEFLDLYGTLTKEFLDCIVGYGVGSAQMGEWFVLHSDQQVSELLLVNTHLST